MQRVPDEERIQLMITIIDRGKGAAVADFYRGENLHFNYDCLGFGTASSEILDCLGLGETQKDIVLTLVPALRVRSLLREAARRFRLYSPGRGILFTIPLTGISGQVQRLLCRREYLTCEKEEQPVEEETRSELVLTILNHGYTDEVMAAAKRAGARGGTVLHARRVGYEEAGNILGFTLQPEKEIIAILVPQDIKHALMQEINRVAGLSTEKAGILLSLPIGDMAGLNFE